MRCFRILTESAFVNCPVIDPDVDMLVSPRVAFGFSTVVGSPTNAQLSPNIVGSMEQMRIAVSMGNHAQTYIENQSSTKLKMNKVTQIQFGPELPSIFPSTTVLPVPPQELLSKGQKDIKVAPRSNSPATSVNNIIPTTCPWSLSP
ncbi:hypothetical protein BKA62DRAFT_773807 [Auriculariales sp. MPI-PUGE-AT-0066]|nr:hypothetical protein BKA62DRAFT_773807 [Auriculariales sp. MPI-PUGE-AT-0066]